VVDRADALTTFPQDCEKDETMKQRKAFTAETEVQAGGKIELTVPIPEGSRVEVVVITEETDEFQNLRDAAARTTDFWDNSIDDAEWNDA
jgi:hypothetical protein